MAEPLKNLYSPSFFDQFSDILNNQLSGFHKKHFLEKIFDEQWDERELKARMKHTAAVLHNFLPDDFPAAVRSITGLIEELEHSAMKGLSLEFMFFPEYIERFGIGHANEAVQAMERVTQFTSCEFAIRPFIVKYPAQTMAKMLEWTLHRSHHVRRLASEGSRPRLPWAMALPEFKKDPQPVLPILENLKTDPSEYVRRSVANNLNDIAKDHPELVIEIGTRWKGISDETDRIVKHGCRTLLKKAHPKALALFGFPEPDDVVLHNFKAENRVAIGEKIGFSFSLKNTGEKALKLRVEYGIDYRKANGSLSRKIFKITENDCPPGGELPFSRWQSFRNMTTRKHYSGQHKLAIIVNGREMGVKEFEVSG